MLTPKKKYNRGGKNHIRTRTDDQGKKGAQIKETFPIYIHDRKVLRRDGWSLKQAVLRLVATWWP